MMRIEPVVAWHLDCLLGEGPVWLESERALRFVDIKRGHVHRFDPASGTGHTQQVGGQPSFIVPSDDGLLVGSGHTVHRLEADGLGPAIVTIDQPSDNRTNDATVDPAGRLWFGTMDNLEDSASGAVWCLADGELYRAGGEAVVTNGPAVSPDGQWLYHVDSGAREVWRFPLGSRRHLADGEIMIRLDEADGHPDGLVVDSEGCLWLALWDGWAVRRYAPDGTFLLQIEFPCARVTKVAFGGPDLTTCFVTTARVGLSDADLARQPLAGSLFAFASPVSGLPLPAVRLHSHAG